MTDELKPCPNPECTGAIRHSQWPDPKYPEQRDFHNFSCMCGWSAPFSDSKEGAITAWNTRGPVSPTPTSGQDGSAGLLTTAPVHPVQVEPSKIADEMRRDVFVSTPNHRSLDQEKAEFERMWSGQSQAAQDYTKGKLSVGDVSEPTDWQDIATAPKDGTVIFVWYLTAGTRGAFADNIKKAQWLPELEEWRVEGVGGNVCPELTHWQPLPAPPNSKGE